MPDQSPKFPTTDRRDALELAQTEVARIGTTSITIQVCVEATQRDSGKHVPVTSAQITFVNLDKDGKAVPVPRSS